MGGCGHHIHCWSQVTSHCSAGFLLAPPFPHFLFGFMKRERSWGWTRRQHTTGFVETRRKRASSPRTGRLHTEGHLSTTCQSLGHRVPEEAPTWVATHLKARVPLCSWANIYLCLGSATFRIHNCVFSQDLRTHVPITDVTCVLIQKWENICQLRHRPLSHLPEQVENGQCVATPSGVDAGS